MYRYDGNGNRLDPNSAQPGDEYQTGANNRLLSDGTYTYTYDDEGNLKTRTEIATGAVRTFSWDYRNRLTGVNDSGGSTTTYTYDAMDRRIAKTVNGTTTRFVYDRDNVALEFGGNGTTPSTRYLQGAGVDQTLAQESSNSTSWLLTDYLGTTRDLVNGSGSVVNHYSYDSFGEVVDSTVGATADTRYKFTGRELDSETGLYYYRARFYDAEMGRFIEQDPIGFEAGDANLYRYVGNSPLNATDPSGMFSIGILYDPTGPAYHADIVVSDGKLKGTARAYAAGPGKEKIKFSEIAIGVLEGVLGVPNITSPKRFGSD